MCLCSLSVCLSVVSVVDVLFVQSVCLSCYLTFHLTSSASSSYSGRGMTRTLTSTIVTTTSRGLVTISMRRLPPASRCCLMEREIWLDTSVTLRTECSLMGELAWHCECNNNNNNKDNIYGAVIVAKATARVHPVHMMNMARCQVATDPQTRPNDPGCESVCRLPEATPTFAIYYYYSARKLILILPSHRG